MKKVQSETPARLSATARVRDGDTCAVVSGPHKGEGGTVRDIKISKTGELTITVVQPDGVSFKTLAKKVITKR